MCITMKGIGKIFFMLVLIILLICKLLNFIVVFTNKLHIIFIVRKLISELFYIYIYSCMFFGSRDQRRMNSSESSHVHMDCRRTQNKRFVTHCVWKSAWGLPLNLILSVKVVSSLWKHCSWITKKRKNKMRVKPD